MSMSSPRLLDPAEIDLAGLQLIEASAGTGKTWTIAALYLRLLLEAGLPVERILVVTYTRAATAELRERIRARLLAAQQAFESAKPVLDDPVLSALKTRVAPQRALALLTLALESFDLAAIHTIHGFCQRALDERAFESGLDFESQLAADDSAVLRAAVEDFWRKELANTSVFWVRWLLPKMRGPCALLTALQAQFGKPYLRQIPPMPWAANSEIDFVATAERVRGLWQNEAAAALALVYANGNLHKGRYKPQQIEECSASLAAWFAAAELALPLPAKLASLTSYNLRRDTAKGKEALEHRLFDALEELQAAGEALEASFTSRLGDLQQRALKECELAVRAAKQRLSRRSFDDLLLDLHGALAGDGGPALVCALRQRYGAALIDEFQDTDPLQYEIFSQVFAPVMSPIPETVGQEQTPLLFVGDPKQAIYSFRGADLHAYLAARTAAGTPWVLGTNRRSVPALVDAVNALFARQENPFIEQALSFSPVASAAQAPLLLEGVAPPHPLEFWCVAPTEQGKLHTKGSVNKRIAAAVADEIVRLLNLAMQGQASIQNADGISERALRGGDIAVLVKGHAQASLVYQALLQCGVASVRYGQDSVYDSAEAIELERVLLAVAEPGREGLVRAALATAICGLRGADLAQLDSDTDAWLRHLQRFHEYHALARDHGFARMWRRLLLESDTAARLLAFPDGERRMTNLQHLGDLLQTLSHDEGMSVEALAKRLADEREGSVEDGAGEAKLLRLESDEHLVKIVTIHSSKGLEYPITFCPFLWDGGLGRARSGPLRFHDPAAEHAASLDFGSSDLAQHKEIAAAEARAEALRLAYVALTRAKHRCIVVWGALTDVANSSLAWLLYGNAAPDFSKPTQENLLAPIQSLAAACPSITWRTLPEVTEPKQLTKLVSCTPLQARVFASRSLVPWRMHSFSAWAASEQASSEGAALVHAELPDHDAQAQAASSEEDKAPPEVNSFPRGAVAGTCLHALFELANFANAEVDVASILQAHGFEEHWQHTASSLLAEVLATPLDGAELRLRQVASDAQRRELEFALPLAMPDMRALAAAIGEGQGADGRLHERLLQLAPSACAGFLKGFIDLVFAHEGRYFLLDYKSNWLGPRFADYAEPQLAHAMAQDDYDLQALLYLVALHRLLKWREPGYDYDTHIGGAYYLFLRGMHPERGNNGVHFWRPSRELIERVDACLTREERLFPC